VEGRAWERGRVWETGNRGRREEERNTDFNALLMPLYPLLPNRGWLNFFSLTNVSYET
jgi:hypothetical protein